VSAGLDLLQTNMFVSSQKKARRTIVNVSNTVHADKHTKEECHVFQDRIKDIPLDEDKANQNCRKANGNTDYHHVGFQAGKR
jgi:hypothetical protein